MNGLNRFTDRLCADIGEFVANLDVAGPIETGFVDFRECDSAVFLFKPGDTWVNGDTVDLEVIQDVAATGSEKAVYTITGVGPEVGEVFACEVKASDLDLDNSFVLAKLKATANVGGAQPAAVGKIYGNFRKTPPPCFAEVYDPEHTTPEDPPVPV